MPTATEFVQAPPEAESQVAPPITIPSWEWLDHEQIPLRPMSLMRKIRGVMKYAWVRIKGGPMLVNMEVTHLCNAQCDFCDFWKTTRSGKLADYDYVDAIQKLDPFCVTLTGGEPTINKNLPDVVKRIRESLGFVYIGMVTHASLLTLEKAQALWDAGIDQIAISLNYLGPQHDTERGIDGLFDRVSELIPQMTARGISVVLNTVIMQDNLDHVIPLAYQARQWGAKISFSSYSDFKNGNQEHLIENVDEVEDLVTELIALKPKLGNIISSNHYLRRVPAYFKKTMDSTCHAAGKWLVQLTPDGEVKPCPELDVSSHYSDFKKQSKPISCDRCFYSCRGETEASLTTERVAELLGKA